MSDFGKKRKTEGRKERKRTNEKTEDLRLSQR
jgi:hypothetical protein